MMFFEKLIIMTKCEAEQNAALLFSYGKETKKSSFGGWHLSGGIIGTYAME
jgi:hypothetical protein